MKREKKLATALVSLFIDEEQKKLYDKLKRYKLSHNRMRILLEMALEYLYDSAPMSVAADYLAKRITQELYGLEHYQEKRKMKGGKDA